MDFSQYKDDFTIRAVGVVITAALLGICIAKGYGVAVLVLGGLLIIQLKSLKVAFASGSDSEVEEFLSTAELHNSTGHYPTNTPNPQLNRLNALLNKLLKRVREVNLEREDDYQYLKNIVQHIGIGLITFDKHGDIQMFNTAARRLLKIEQVANVRDLKAVDENLVEMLLRLRTGGRDLLRLEINTEIVQLAIYAIELTLRGEVYKLISIQNIQNELEEKEMEAWQNLVRVLTHEIMNSVTPISSLAHTVEQELHTQLTNDQDVNQITNEEVEDLHLAVKTIQKRSDGLIRFVQDFRNLTHIPIPKLVPVNVKDLVDELVRLLDSELKSNQVQMIVTIDPEDMIIKADKTMIEQVVINLIKNAIQAFDEQQSRAIEVLGYQDEKGRPVIEVADNGSGIDEEALEKIFIPFFTTKKTGSGIGLSLSRQIMRKHQGTLNVKSKVDEGTRFFLRF